MALHPALQSIGERFTIGLVLVHSWQAFVANRWRFLLTAVAVSTISMIHYRLTGQADVYASHWSFFSTLWISAALQSLAIAPITLGVLVPAYRMSSSKLHPLGHGLRTLKIMLAICGLQAAAYWPVAIYIEIADGEMPSLIGYVVLAINVVVVGTMTYLYFPVFLMERCSLWSSALLSMAQVRPHIWPIVALNLLFWLIYFGGSWAIVLVAHPDNAGTDSWAFYALWWAFMAGLLLGTNILPAVTYRLLRAEREGPDPSHLARVFD